MTQQQYTPVSWQDETTSQQGTLINAERLNQMQTAHHSADGFEEVDTAPTADPGVGYHKVVYCTADSTFYRWDGTQWQKDIDDDTKALLLEHEADHDNPHEVTKAQVGLGNADNTSDLDKPISTATQTALDGKVSIIPVTTGVKFYAQTSGGTYLYQGTQDATAGITSVPLRDSSGRIRTATPSGDNDAVPKKYVDDGLAAKADKATTYTKTETDTLLASKADVATTLAGYGIADAYTKTEADTLLGAKADQATTYTKSEVNTALALKADKANTYTETETDTAIQNALDNYATMVRTANNQTISGIKTFTDEILGRIYSNKSVHIYDGTANWYKVFSISTTERQQHILEVDYINNARNVTGEGRMLISHAGGENVCKFINYYANPASYIVPGNIALCVGSSSIDIWAKRSAIHHIHIGIIKSLIGTNAIFMPESKIAATYDPTQGQASIPEADYSAVVYGTDISSDYVHTSGAETIAGAKTFTGQMLATGQRAYSAGNTTDVATIGTLDAYTPMVRTTGNQTINGTKAFQSALVGASIQLKTVDLDITTPGTSSKYSNAIMWTDENNVAICKLWIVQRPTGQIALGCDIKNSDGSWKFGQILAQGDVIA